jgi:tetraacyldisaccharide 4'-kinase
MLGADQTGAATLLGTIPLLAAEPRPPTTGLAGRAFVLFAGIGRPQKFFDHFARSGVRVVAARGFPDHHRYSEGELTALVEMAKQADATLMTTEKDWVRLAPSWRARIQYLPLAIVWRDEAALDQLLDGALKRT